MPSFTHLLWPKDLGHKEPSGFLVGWTIGRILCVVALEHGETAEQVQLRVTSIEQGQPALHGLRVVGHFAASEDELQQSRTGASSDIVIVLDQGLPRAVSPYGSTPITVLYIRSSMKRHHFLALTPLLDALAPLDEADRKELEDRNALAETMRKLHRADGASLANHTDFEDRSLERIVECINASQEVCERLRGKFREVKVSQDDSMPSEAAFEDLQLPPLVLKSALVQQVMVRIRQVARWPRRYRAIWKGNASTLASRRAAYVRLFNTVWLIANDVCIGYSTSTLLRHHSAPLARFILEYLDTWSVQQPIELLQWMNSYPAGLKLNDELGRAFCEGSIRAIQLWWHHAFLPVSGLLSPVLYLFGLTSTFGATFALAASADLLSLCTAHLWLLYRVATFVFRWHLRILGVLFDIFRGRKYNLLRDRREPATYEIDQLILGTIFFTLATFLFPTVLAFYLLIATSRLAIISIYATIETALALLNHFPLFAVLLRLKEPARVPVGVRLRPVKRTRPDVLRLESVPVGLTWIFSDYVTAWRKLTAHYSPLHLLSQLFCGLPMEPMPRYHIGDD